MHLKLLCVGKSKDLYLRAAVDDYLQRIRRYTPVTYTEIKAEKRKKTENETQVKQREAERLEKLLTPSDVVVALDEHGAQYSSVGFSEFLSRAQHRGDIKTVVFVTGGATGFAETFLSRAQHVMSLSKMTFPHQFCRLLLVEQLYRAYTILAGESYHKI